MLFFRKRCHWYTCFLELDYWYCFSFQINWVLALERWPKDAAFLPQDQEGMRPRGWFLIWVLCHCWLCNRKGIHPVIDLLELPRPASGEYCAFDSFVDFGAAFIVACLHCMLPHLSFFLHFSSLIFFFVNRCTPVSRPDFVTDDQTWAFLLF